MNTTNEWVLKEILEGSLAGYWDWDIPTGEKYLSSRFKKMFGYEDSEIENNALSIYKLIFEEDLPGVLKNYEEHVKSKGEIPYSNEVRYHHKDGSTVWVICTGKVIEWDNDGGPKRMVGCHVDITIQKRAQMAYKENEERFHTLFEKAPLGYQSLDEEGRFIEVNQAWLDTLGYSREEVLGKWFGDFLVPEYVAVFRKCFSIFKAEGRIHSEFYMIHKDGSRKYIAFDGRIGYNADAKFKQTHCILKDETKRKKATEALRDSLEFQRALINGLPDIIMRFDQDGRVLFVSENIGNIAKLDPDQYIGKTLRELGFNEEQCVMWEELIRSVFASGNPRETEFSMEHKTGRMFFNLRLLPEFDLDGKTQSFLSICRDITKNKKNELMIQENKIYLSQAQSIAKLGYFSFDPEVNIFEGSEELFRIFDFKPESQMTLSEVFSYVVHPDDNYLILPCIDKALKEEISYNVEHRIRQQDGSILYVNSKGEVLNTSQGRRVIGTVQDISERKQIEDVLGNTQKLESLGLLAGGIAHDFNNLLGGVFGYIELAKAKSTEEKVVNYLSKTLNSIDSARGLTGQLLTFAKGGSPIKRVETLFPFIQETAEFSLSGTSVSCQFEIEEDLWLCEFDRNQIGQVLGNIVINAQQAMPLGGIIKISACNIILHKNEHLHLAGGNYIKISIKDSGVGIPHASIARIFDPFFTTKFQGHGLGLATCYSIVRKHSGCIDVDSEPGKGTTFDIFMPASTVVESIPEVNTVADFKGAGTFLVMDDEEAIRETIGGMLKSLGYQVVLKTKGEDALDFFIAETQKDRIFAGLLLDLTIPAGMGGAETVVAIRKLDSEVPIFVASGYSELSIMKNPVEYGFTDSICKPFILNELIKMLIRNLGNKK